VLYKTQGIIIKKTNLGESDRLITVYSQHLGKILLKAKAIRKNQAKLRGHLELFLHSHLMVAPAKGLDVITGAEIINSFSYLHQGLSCLAAAHYLAELVDKLVIAPEKDDHIWRLVLSSFQELNRPGQNVKAVTKNFETKLLEFLGYGKNQPDSISSIYSLIGDKIYSRNFLQKTNNLLE